MSHFLRIAVTVTAASAIYLTLAYFTINYAFGAAPSLEWAQATFGRLVGTRIWSQSAHAAGLFLAAIPTAAVLVLARRPMALTLALATGLLTAVAALVPSFLHPEVRPYLDTSFYVIAAIDSVKTVLILMLVTWLFTKLPS